MEHGMDRGGKKDWRRIGLRYGLAVIAVVAAGLLRWWLERTFGNLYAAFITFYPAVLLVAITLGGGPGVMATLLSAAVVDFFFIPPYNSFAVVGIGETISLAIFACTSLGLCWVSHRMRQLGWARAFAAAKALEAEELARRNEELRRSNHDLEQFAYVASHDLQEPLRMVTSFGGIIEDRYRPALDEKGREYLRFIIEAGQRMQSLVKGLLDYSRVRGQDHPEPVALGECVREALANLKAGIEEAGATVAVGELPTVPADRRQMTQVFQNLIGNAIKFHGDKPPRIELSAARDGGQWLVRVTDNGIGVDPRYAERIFEIFQRLHGREKYPGTGIGLAICRRIVEGHGGRIGVKPALEGGSTFWFTLPGEAKGSA